MPYRAVAQHSKRKGAPLARTIGQFAGAKAAGLKTILNPVPAHEDLCRADVLR